MGVMSCSRNDCEEIMCDTYIEDVGYVCSECQFKFKQLLEKEDKNEGVLTRKEMAIAFSDFMKTSKHFDSDDDDYTISVDEFFK